MSPGYYFPTKRRLVGQPLIYTMTVFISLGVFLVRVVSFKILSVQTTKPPYVVWLRSRVRDHPGHPV